MEHEYLDDRRKSLEEQFFAKYNHERLERMREQREEVESREALAAATGIEDEGVLHRLVEIGVRVDTLSALYLFPLVFVAWADHKLDDKERRAILKASGEAGVEKDSVAYHMLEQWLNREPSNEVFDAWKGYVEALRGEMADSVYNSLRDDVIGRARRVAQSAGGYLGMMSVSAAEEARLSNLEKAFG